MFKRHFFDEFFYINSHTIYHIDFLLSIIICIFRIDHALNKVDFGLFVEFVITKKVVVTYFLAYETSLQIKVNFSNCTSTFKYLTLKGLVLAQY